MNQKLEMAFGIGREELQRPLKLWLPEKGVLLAAGEFSIDDKDGRVRLQPFSAALFHKNKVPGGYPEISTIQCEIAYLTLDHPVKLLSELNNRKVIAIEMRGSRAREIKLSNNRRTAEKSDDVDVFITNGYLFYEERRNLIWSDGIVNLTDCQTKPPTTISGKGMEMLLAKATNPNQPKPAKAAAAKPGANSDSSSVEKIILKSHVIMNFWVDSRPGFLGGAPRPNDAQAAEGARVDEQTPPDKAHIHITTGGAFHYDLIKEYAWFESPAAREGTAVKGDNDPFDNDQVHVTRSQKVDKKDKLDQLTCFRLDLQFRKKANPSTDPAATGSDKEIETATAIRQGANYVVLALESEHMDAFGNEMLFRAGDARNGPMTILKGDPLRTFKDGHKMISKELHLFGADRNGEGQHAWARGPGQIDLLDGKSTAKQASFPTHIIWQDTLTVVKDKEGGQVFDLMTVKGDAQYDASFIDDQQGQYLHGKTIMVWMTKNEESAKKPQASGGAKQELHRVIAQDHVRAKSADFIIRRADVLVMTFLPEVARADRLPTLPSGGEVTSVVNSGPADPTGIIPPAVGPMPITSAPIETKGSEEKKKEPPIELEGNDITMAIATVGPKKQLHELVAKGNVLVFQPGDPPG